MPTVLLDPLPREIALLAERRRALGQDRLDEMWEGVLHMVPAPSFEHAVLGARVKSLLAPLAAAAGLVVTDEFNLGDSEEDFRVPDGGLHRQGATGIWQPTAALVLEIVSPGDETWQKRECLINGGSGLVGLVDSSFERYRECVEGWLPSHRPASAASSCGV